MCKRWLASFLAVFLMFGMISCEQPDNEVESSVPTDTESTTDANDETIEATEDTGMEEKEEFPMTTYKITDSTAGIKVLGERYLAAERQLNCDWTGSGLEMNVFHSGGDIIFTVRASSECYFRAYVDGEVWNNDNGEPLYTVASRTGVALRNVPEGEHTIKLIKVTGYTIARAAVLDVTFAGTISEVAPTSKDLYIEFVGDSISCGWGTIGTKDGKYTGQDGTVAYPLMVAEALDADYAVTALSGQGLLFRYAPYHNIETGYLYASPLRSTNKEYSFERKADIVVVNIGTNDYHHLHDTMDHADFGEAYLDFLKTIKEKNGDDCVIYCLYNTMNDTFYEQIISACEKMGGEAEGVYTVKMARAKKGVNGHPSLEEQGEYAEFLIEILKGNLKKQG